MGPTLQCNGNPLLHTNPHPSSAIHLIFAHTTMPHTCRTLLRTASGTSCTVSAGLVLSGAVVALLMISLSQESCTVWTKENAVLPATNVLRHVAIGALPFVANLTHIS